MLNNIFSSSDNFRLSKKPLDMRTRYACQNSCLPVSPIQVHERHAGCIQQRRAHFKLATAALRADNILSLNAK